MNEILQHTGQPNIVFILIDDMGWKDLACCGSPFYETPCLDRLAAEGMRFTNASAACPVCSPTRASILTGKYPATVGITDWIDWGGNLHPARGRVVDVPYLKALPATEYTLAHALKDGGYATWHIGKWHLGGPGHRPTDHGFDVNIGGCEWGCPQKGYFSPWHIPVLHGTDVPPGTYLTDFLTDRAIALIHDHRPGSPFFLNMAHYAVHTPVEAPDALVRKYREKARRLGLDQINPFETGAFFPCEHKKDQRILRRRLQSDPVYAAMIENLDSNIGRLLAAIEDAGETDNTLVIFTSDNGGLATAEGSPTCNAPLAEGKGWMYEGGIREPLLVKWPGIIAPGRLCDTPVTSPDFYPTLLDAAGLAAIPEQHGDGISLMPLLTGRGIPERDAIFWHYPHYGNQGGTPGSAVRRGDYKLIEFLEDGRIELYNLRDDPGECHNLALELPAAAAELQERLAVWRASVEAKIPRPNPEWEPAS